MVVESREGGEAEEGEGRRHSCCCARVLSVDKILELGGINN